MRAQSVGVIRGGELYINGGGTRPIGRALTSVNSVIHLANSLNLYSVWLLDNLGTDRHEWWALDAEQWPRARRWPQQDREEPHTAALYSRQVDGWPRWSVYVCDLTRDPRWPASMDPAIGAQAWAQAVWHAEYRLGVPMRFSPGSAGLRLLQRLLPEDALTDVQAAGDLPQAPAANDATPTLPAGRYWHIYDRNAAYLAAMQSTPLGIGPAVEFGDGCPVQPSKKLVNYQLTAAEARRAAGELPSMFRGPGAYDGAAVRLLNTEPDAGRYWPHSRPYLRQFAEELWRLRREAVSMGDRLLLALAKRIYTETYGNLNAQRVGQVVLYRPHWHAAIRAESARRVITDLRRWQAAGAFAASIDAIVVAADTPRPEGALPQERERERGLGGYKHAYSLTPSDGLRADVRRALAARNGGSALQLIGAAVGASDAA